MTNATPIPREHLPGSPSLAEGCSGGDASPLRPSTRAYRFDGSFDGFLTAVFEAYRRRERPVRIMMPDAEDAAASLFGAAVDVATSPEAAARVRAGLAARVGEGGVETLRRALLSEAEGVEDDAFAVVARVFDEGGGVFDDLRDPAVLRAVRLAGRVAHEVHRMHAFVRFERRAGEVWVARIAPDAHVLPLLAPHFGGRYGSQAWAIADVRRGLALAHEPGQPLAVVHAGPLLDLPPSADEATFQRLWQRYIVSTTIAERRNPRLQRRHLPLRYRAYLTEWQAEAP